MTYRPNVWLTEELHRRIAMATKQFSQYTLLLRPTRRHIFMRMFRVDPQIKEFFRPCFGILAKHNDPDKKPCLVIETNNISENMKRLYELHSILWISIKQEQNRFILECSHGGTEMRLEDSSGNLFKLLSAPLSWYEKNVSFPQGSFVHSYSERVLREAVQTLSPSYRIECHHQVPLSHILGVKSDLSPDEKRLLGHEIDVVITQSIEADQDCAVILPVKLDIHDSHQDNSDVSQRDDAVKLLCKKYGVPLLTVTGNPDKIFTFDCPQLNLPETNAEGQSPDSWAGALAPFLGAAIRYAGRGF